MKSRKNIILSLLSGLLLLASCGSDAGDPVMYFVEAEGFQSKDTMLMVGDSAKIGLYLEWNGKNDLLNLEVAVSGVFIRNLAVEQNRGEYAINLVKDASQKEEWQFTLTDTKNHAVSKSITFTKDPNSVFGGVIGYQHVVLGTQSNPINPGFLDLGSPEIYDLGNAFVNQSEVDLLLYYDISAAALVLASPGANIPDDIYTGDKRPQVWETRNHTALMLSGFSADDFSKFVHDGHILTAFDPESTAELVSPLAEGQVYLFKTTSGLYGGLLINTLTGGIDGQADFSLIIQDK